MEIRRTKVEKVAPLKNSLEELRECVFMTGCPQRSWGPFHTQRRGWSLARRDSREWCVRLSETHGDWWVLSKSITGSSIPWEIFLLSTIRTGTATVFEDHWTVSNWVNILYLSGVCWNFSKEIFWESTLGRGWVSASGTANIHHWGACDKND